jgi:hypothetical protein
MTIAIWRGTGQNLAAIITGKSGLTHAGTFILLHLLALAVARAVIEALLATVLSEMIVVALAFSKVTASKA